MPKWRLTRGHIQRTDAPMHRPLPEDTELARGIAVLARAHQDATWRRTKATNELRSLLRDYHPSFFLAAFAAGNATNLANPDARAVLATAPTPAAAATLSTARIAAALRRAGRKRRADQLATRLRQSSRNPVIYAELPGGQHTFNLFHSVRFEILIDGSRSSPPGSVPNRGQPPHRTRRRRHPAEPSPAPAPNTWLSRPRPGGEL